MLAALTAPLAGCGNLLMAEVEQPEVCKTLPDNVFSGSEYTKTMEINVSEQLPGLDVTSPTGVQSTFFFNRVDFIAKSGITDFDFVDSAKISVLPPDGSDLPPVAVIDFTRTEPSGTTLSMVGSSKIDLYQYLTAGVVKVEAALTGRLPSTDWSMDIKPCLYAKVKANYVDLVNIYTTPPPPPPAP